MSNAFFGLTGAGKSSVINHLVGSPVAPVGYCSTTKESCKYALNSKSADDGKEEEQEPAVLIDTRGLGDGTEYLTEDQLLWLNELDNRIIVISNSIREATSLINLFEVLHPSYCILVNKCDRECKTADNLMNHRARIAQEMQDCQIDHHALFLVSTKMPTDYQDDWTKFKSWLMIE